MATIVYLDVDDEITSAAARLRASDERQVGLVLPYGSRLATSRINFRLLAREAQTHDRELAIVAGDAATRALAASAGLGVHATVGDFEASLNGGTAEGGAAPAADPGHAADPAHHDRPAAARETARDTARDPSLEATVIASSTSVRAEPVRAGHADAIIEVPPAGAAGGTARGRSVRVVGPRRSFSRPAMLAGLVALLVVVVVGGVAAYVFLPSASVRLTPRIEAVIPVSFDVRADPTASEPDPVVGVVPAERISIPLGVTGTFPASGVRVEETRANGVVRFTSENTFVPVTIPAGTRVATQSGVAFSTREAVTVDRASFLSGPTSATVAVDAQGAGPGGNVAAGTITELSEDIRQFLISVTNPEPTSGGSRMEFPRVEQVDVDAAMTELTAQLGAQLDERLADPTTAPPGRTLFAGTKLLGEAVPSVDPASLVGQEIATFDLGLTAEGSVTVVDEEPLAALAAHRIRDAVDADHRLLDESIEVDVGTPTVNGASVLFPVSARASQVAVLDGETLREAILGRPIHQARAILEDYGAVEIEVWPDWVTAIPTIDGRVTLAIVDGTDGDRTPSPSQRASPPASPSVSPIPPPSASPEASS